MKKCLMLIASKAQLLQCFHIRQKMLTNCYVDIVLLGKQFDRGYADRLKPFFDHAWFVPENYYTQKEYLKFYFSPKKALKNKIDSEIETDYSDIFCWDPGWCWYWFVRNERKEGIKYNWHLIQDGNGNYSISSVKFEHQHKARNIIENIIQIIETRVLHIFPLEYDDEYLWKPELRVVPYDHVIIKVPVIDVRDNNEIRDLNFVFAFDVNHNNLGNNKYIFLDTLVQCYYEYTSQIIKELSQKLNGIRISIFIHPRSDKAFYNNLRNYVDLKECRAPWELYYINGLANDKIILGTYTSALSMGFICCDDKTDIYSFVKLFDIEKLEREGWEPRCGLPIYEKVASFDDRFHLVESVDELLSIIRTDDKR